MTHCEALRFGRSALKRHTCPGADPIRDAETLLSFVTGDTKESILTHPDRRVGFLHELLFRGAVRRRAHHVPIAHITGHAWFFGRIFSVSRHVLIPRPATETIVEYAIAAARDMTRPAIFDVGTGSGCIAITLASELPDAHIIATDVSRTALGIAMKNARKTAVADRIDFRRDDLLTHTWPLADEKDPALIVANLPYIPTDRIEKLCPDVREHEPRGALDGGSDGLDAYRKLIDQLTDRKRRPRFTLLMEMLPEQAASVTEYAQQKIPGCRAREMRNPSGITVGVSITER